MSYTTINKSSEHFNTKLYTGNGTNATGITGVGFQPDWVWIKERSSTSPHKLLDAVRGATKELESNSTATEQTESTSLQSFDSDGFTVGTNGAVNENSQTYASWNWKAGTTSGLSGGTITPSAYSINATSGFGIYAYTGTNANGTITHGLGSAPSVIIVKNRLTSSKSWVVGHKSIGFQNALFLNSTDAQASEPNLFNSTAPTSSVFTVGTGSLINDSGDSYIAYAFAEKTGYSKIGSYIGNGNADGTFVYTGFKPAWVMYKNSSSVADWLIYDTKRIHSGTQLDYLEPNTSDAEGYLAVDVLSNGFKLREASGAKFNASGDTYIYMAFAAAPLVGTNNVPCTAR